MKGRGGWGRIVCFMLAFAIIAGLAPISLAEKIPDPEGIEYDANGYLIVDHQGSLEKKIKEAKDLGVEVALSEVKEAPVHVRDAEANGLMNKLADHNTKEIAKLDKAIEDQIKHNAAYEGALKDSLLQMLGNHWDYEAVKKFILTKEEQEMNETVQLAKMVEKMTTASVVTASPETKYIEEKSKITEKDWFAAGDHLYYEKLFKDGKTGNWVDVDITFESFKDPNGNPKEKIQWYNYTIYGFLKDKPWFCYRLNDARLRVDFKDHATGEPVQVRPIIAVVDIDGTQGVGLDKPGNYRVLYGKNISPDEKKPKIYRSNNEEDPKQGIYKEHWVLFTSEPTASFTYTFYHQTTKYADVIQGIGGDAVKYTPPEDELQKEKVEITLKNQPIYHKVTYEFVGDGPKGVEVPVDETKYLLNQELKPFYPESPVKDSRGTWTFKGWFEDKELTKPLFAEKSSEEPANTTRMTLFATATDDSAKTAHPVNLDEKIYGGWELSPNRPPAPSTPDTPAVPEDPAPPVEPGQVEETKEEPTKPAEKPEEGKKEVEKKPEKKPLSPNTGDRTDMVVWALILIGTMVGLVYVQVKRRKESR